MFNIFRKRKTSDLYQVTYKFAGESESHTITATSASLASLDADWCIEVLSVVKI